MLPVPLFVLLLLLLLANAADDAAALLFDAVDDGDADMMVRLWLFFVLNVFAVAVVDIQDAS